MPDILVLGATGLTGSLITQYLSTHPDRAHFSFGIAARSRHRLLALAVQHKLRAVDEASSNDGNGETVTVHAVNLDDPTELAPLIAQFRVVINVVGHYWLSGTAVVDACVSRGVHYLDLCGELPWLVQVIERYDTSNHASGSIIVPCCGVEALPSDLCVFESVRALQQRTTAPNTAHKGDGSQVQITKSVTAHEFGGTFTSSGSLASSISLFEDVPKPLLWHSLNPFCLGPVQQEDRVPFRLTHSLDIGTSHSRKEIASSVSDRPTVLNGSFCLLSLVNRPTIYRSWGLRQEARNLLASPSATPFVYGPKFEHEEFLVVPELPLGLGHIVRILITAASVLFAYLLVYFPVTWFLRRLAKKEGINPTYEALRGGAYAATNVTCTDTGARARTTFKTIGCDGGYLGTAVMIAESALCLVLTPRADLPLAQFAIGDNTIGSTGNGSSTAGGNVRGHRGRRVLTPSVALGSVLTTRLQASGYFDISTDML